MSAQGFRIKDVAALSGLSDHVIRMWERRYALVRPERTANGYRLYSEDDLQLLLYLKAQLDSGRTIGELAAQGAGTLREAMAQTEATLPDLPDALRRQGLEILHSARRLDSRTTVERVHRAVVDLGIGRAVTQLLFPVLRTVGDLWHRGEIGTRGERVISWTVRQELVEALTSPQGDGPPVVVACTPGEFHELGAMTAALFLQQNGWHVTYLGPDTGLEVLQLACTRRRAALVVLSCTLGLEERDMRRLVDRLRARVAPRCPVLIGGRAALDHARLLDGRDVALLTDLHQVRGLAPAALGPTAASRDPAGRRQPRRSRPAAPAP